jgi:hypothetical protein
MKDSTIFLLLGTMLLLISIFGIAIGKPLVLCAVLTMAGCASMVVFLVALSEDN